MNAPNASARNAASKLAGRELRPRKGAVIRLSIGRMRSGSRWWRVFEVATHLRSVGLMSRSASKSSKSSAVSAARSVRVVVSSHLESSGATFRSDAANRSVSNATPRKACHLRREAPRLSTNSPVASAAVAPPASLLSLAHLTSATDGHHPRDLLIEDQDHSNAA